MLNKSTIAVAAALILGTASVALAAETGSDKNAQGGFDNLGSNGKSVESPNPALQPPAVQSPRQPEQRIQTEGRGAFGSSEGLNEQGGRKDPQTYPGSEVK
jgi:hypothetical protein